MTMVVVELKVMNVGSHSCLLRRRRNCQALHGYGGWILCLLKKVEGVEKEKNGRRGFKSGDAIGQ